MKKILSILLIISSNTVISQNLFLDYALADSGSTSISTGFPYRGMAFKSFMDGSQIACGKIQDRYMIWPGVIQTIIPLISKYDICGSIDSTYGINGFAYTSFPDNASESIYNLMPMDYIIQESGSVILAGSNDTLYGYNENLPTIIKINSSGFIDSSFINPDFWVYPELTDQFGQFLSVSVTEENKYLGILSFFNASNKLVLTRLNQNGSIDTTFGNYGVYIFESDLLNTIDIKTAKKINDGGYIIGGTFYESSPTQYKLALIKLTENWELDTLFNNSGYIINDNYNIQFAEVNDWSLDIEVINDKILISTINKIDSPNANNYTYNLNLELINEVGNSINEFGQNGFINIPNSSVSRGILSTSTIDTIFQVGYINYDLDSAIVIWLDQAGNYPASINSGNPLIIEDNTSLISHSIIDQGYLKLLGGTNETSIVVHLTRGNFYPNLTMSGSLISSSIDMDSSNEIIWYLNGELLIGEQADTLNITQTGEYIINVLRPDNCVILADTINIITVNIEKPIANKLLIFPNPAKDILHIESNDKISKIEIFDSFGLISINSEINIESNIIDITSLKNGLYFLRVNGVYNSKFIVSK